MPKHTVRANESEVKNKYILEIDRRKGDEGDVRRIKFRSIDAAIKLAELLHRRQTKVTVFNPSGEQIFPT